MRAHGLRRSPSSQHQGRWHLYAPNRTANEDVPAAPHRQRGHHHRQAVRPPLGDQAPALADLEAVWNAHIAVVEVEPGTDAATRL